MLSLFRLKKPVGEAHTMDLEDSLNTKLALARLGYLETPERGFDAYPDRALIDALKGLQRDHGLTADGVMKPGGPTHRRLNEILSGLLVPDRDPGPLRPIALTGPVTASTSADLGDIAQVKSALGGLGLPPSGDPDDPYPTPQLFRDIRAFQRQQGLREDGEMQPGGETEGRMNEAIREIVKAGSSPSANAERDGANETEVAARYQRPGRLPTGLEGVFPLEGGGGGGGGGAIGAVTAAAIAAAFQAFVEEQRKKGKAYRGEFPPRGPISWSDVIELFPDLADPDPSPEDDRSTEKTEVPTVPPALPTLEGRPIGELIREDPMIFDEVSEELRKLIDRPQESNRGDPVTRKGNRIVAKACRGVLEKEYPDLADRIDHVGGATKDGKGARLPEKYLKDPTAKSRGLDPRSGSSNPDLSWRHRDRSEGDPEAFAHANTTTLGKRGALTAAERRSFKRLSEKVGSDLATHIPKLRPGMDEGEYERMAYEKCREIFGKWLGRPSGNTNDSGAGANRP